MTLSAIVARLAARGIVLGAVLAASAAFAQSGVPALGNDTNMMQRPASSIPPVAPGTTAADVAAAPGLPGPDSVDPAPGATGPYAGHSQNAFYDVNARISRYEQRIASNLSGAQQKSAMKQLASIRSEEKAQIARHGSLLDWARENLNHRLDQMKQTYPALVG